MKERPILFSGPMVRAILEGRKTQTRRAILPKPNQKWLSSYGIFPRAQMVRGSDGQMYAAFEHPKGGPGTAITCPYGQPGDRLWVRETWGLRRHTDITNWGRGSVVGWPALYPEWELDYQADWGSNQESCFWRPSIHMPRWASRLTLDVTGVRVERLQDISEEDAKAEGVEPAPFCKAGRWPGLEHVESFEDLWVSINGRRDGCAWEDNPWVWVVEFRRAEVDQ